MYKIIISQSYLLELEKEALEIFFKLAFFMWVKAVVQPINALNFSNGTTAVTAAFNDKTFSSADLKCDWNKKYDNQLTLKDFGVKNIFHLSIMYI